MRRVPIIAIQGGLGNQLFQWFYAHGILDTPGFNIYTKYPEGPSVNLMREFGLAPVVANCSHCGIIFNEPVRPTRANLFPQILDRVWTIGILSLTLKKLGIFQGDAQQSVKINSSRTNRIIYVNGYFQKWNYAKKQQRWIDSELLPVLRTLHSELGKQFDLSEPYTVIHVRRGDYRADKNPLAWMGCLADEYFIQLAKEHPSSRIVLLAEHKDEVEDLVSALKPYLVLDSTLTTPWETLAIMSGARTFFGSNSSLSWWGAWMASINGASTYLPSKWDIKGKFDPADFLFPECSPRTPVWESFPNT
jgi:hypothetical protein